MHYQVRYPGRFAVDPDTWVDRPIETVEEKNLVTALGFEARDYEQIEMASDTDEEHAEARSIIDTLDSLQDALETGELEHPDRLVGVHDQLRALRPDLETYLVPQETGHPAGEVQWNGWQLVAEDADGFCATIEDWPGAQQVTLGGSQWASAGPAPFVGEHRYLEAAEEFLKDASQLAEGPNTQFTVTVTPEAEVRVNTRYPQGPGNPLSPGVGQFDHLRAQLGDDLEVAGVRDDLDVWMDAEARRAGEYNPVATTTVQTMTSAGRLSGPVVFTGARDEGVMTPLNAEQTVEITATADNARGRVAAEAGRDLRGADPEMEAQQQVNQMRQNTPAAGTTAGPGFG